MKLLSFIPTKIAILLLLSLGVFLGRLEYVQYKNKRSIEKEKQKILGQIEQLSQKNQELSRSLSYLSSPGFKEHIAREQLNLKKDGEAVYSFSQNPGNAPLNTNPLNTKSNSEKWLEYFFGTH